MTRPTRSPRAAWLSIPITIALLTAAILVPAASVTAAEPTDMVLEWNINAINAIQNANGATPPGLGQVPPLAPLNLAIVHAAIYDAVNAIDGTHKPYLLHIHAPPDASQAAAAATAAHHVLVGIVPTTLPQVTASLDELYKISLAKITDGKAKSDGITVGAAAAAVMLEKGKGSIVNISSGASLVAMPQAAPYGAAKAAVNNLTGAMAAAWTPKGIRVNTIAVGAVRAASLLDIP